MTRIEWTDESWNPVVGCTPVSPGCAHCYAQTMALRLQAMGVRGYDGEIDDRGHWTGKINLIDEALEKPLHWREPRMVFVNSMSDLFHESVPFEFIDRVFAVMALCPQHTFQVLTKRPERMLSYLTRRERNRGFIGNPRGIGDPPEWAYKDPCDKVYSIVRQTQKHAPLTWPLPNVWLGVSCENQEQADKRILILLECPAAVRFVSAEPLLERIDFAYTCFNGADSFGTMPGIDWVICGGESGPNARPMDEDWVRDIRDQCVSAGVAFFYKQKVERGRKIGLPELDGKVWSQFPGGREGEG